MCAYMRMERTVYVEPPMMAIYDEVIVVGMPGGIVDVHDADVGEVIEVGGGEGVALVEIDDVDVDLGVDVFTKVVVVCVLERVVVGMMDVTMDVGSDKEVGSASLVGSVDAVLIALALVESVMDEFVADCADSQPGYHRVACHSPETRSTCQQENAGIRYRRRRTRSQSTLLVVADSENGCGQMLLESIARIASVVKELSQVALIFVIVFDRRKETPVSTALQQLKRSREAKTTVSEALVASLQASLWFAWSSLLPLQPTCNGVARGVGSPQILAWSAPLKGPLRRPLDRRPSSAFLFLPPRTPTAQPPPTAPRVVLETVHCPQPSLLPSFCTDMHSWRHPAPGNPSYLSRHPHLRAETATTFHIRMVLR